MIPKRAQALWPFFLKASKQHAVDAILLLAICDRECLCGQTLESDGTGDSGWGLGLMQIDKRAHPDFAKAALPDGSPAWRDPETNILKGAEIFAECLFRLADEDAAIAAYNAGVTRVRRELEDLTNPGDQELYELRRRQALDALTTHGNYVTDVRQRAEMFRASQPPPTTPPPPKPEGVP